MSAYKTTKSSAARDRAARAAARPQLTRVTRGHVSDVLYRAAERAEALTTTGDPIPDVPDLLDYAAATGTNTNVRAADAALVRLSEWAHDTHDGDAAHGALAWLATHATTPTALVGALLAAAAWTLEADR